MPTWAQIFAAFFPIVLLFLAGILHVERRIATLEGKLDALLALLALSMGVPVPGTKQKAKGTSFRPPDAQCAGD